MTEEYEVYCDKCNVKMKVKMYDFRDLGLGFGYYIFAYCPKCAVVKPILAEGRIPFEAARAMFKSHKEVF